MSGSSGARARLWRFSWEHRVRDDPAVKGRVQEALLVMATFSDPDGTLRVGEKRLAQCIGKDVRTARRAIEEGQEAGYLERLTKGHNVPGKDPEPSRYRLVLPGPTGAQDLEPDPVVVDAIDEAAPPDSGDRLRVVGDSRAGDWMSA